MSTLRHFVNTGRFVLLAFFFAAITARAEEQPNQLLTALGSTTISGSISTFATSNSNSLTLPRGGFYSGVVPYRTNALVVFTVHLGSSLEEPLKIQLIGTNSLTQERVLLLTGDVTNKPNGVVKATFPFGGRFRGHLYQKNVIGRFYGFVGDRQHLISRKRFELHADPPVNLSN